MYVYVIKQDIKKGPVKIGMSSQPSRRIGELQTGNAVPLVLEGLIVCSTVAGAKALEREIHGLFPELRLAGEWFSYTANLRNYLRGCAEYNEDKKERALFKHRRQVARGHFRNRSTV